MFTNDRNQIPRFKYKIFTKTNKTNAAKKLKQLNLIIKDLAKVEKCKRVCKFFYENFFIKIIGCCQYSIVW